MPDSVGSSQVRSWNAATIRMATAMTTIRSNQLTDVLNELDASSITELTQDLMKVPSVTGSAAEAELQHTIAQEMTELGADVDRWAIDLESTRNHPD